MTSSPPPTSTTPSLVVSTSPSPASSSAPASPSRTTTHSSQPTTSSATSATPQRRSKSPSPSTPHHRTASTSSNRSMSSRARSLSPAPATSHSLSALRSPPGVPSYSSGTMSPPTSSASPSSSSSPSTAVPAGSTIRPAPVVPPSPSVPATPGYGSRPTSPRPSEPASPTRARASSNAGGAGAGTGGLLLSAASPLGLEKSAGGEKMESSVSRSGSQVDLSHIFERDVEFAPSHHISPSEAVDVAVPPVLTAAAEALSFSTSGDPLVAHELATLANEAEQDAQAGSGWSSPVLTPGGVGLYHPNLQAGHAYAPHQSSPLHAHHPMANSSRSPVRGMGGNARSFSPDSNRSAAGQREPRSPDSTTAGDDYSSTAGFSVGTPPTSNSGGSPPPTLSAAGSPKVQPGLGGASSAGIIPLGPFGQRLAEALENEANKPTPSSSSSGLLTPGGSGRRDASPESTTAKATTYTPLKPSLLLPFPGALSDSSQDPFSGFSPASTSASAFSSSPLHSPSYEGSNPFASLPSSSSAAGGASPNPNPALAAPHPRRLSFYSYADLINEERIQELKGEGIGPVSTAVAVGAEPAGLGVVGVGAGAGREAGSRNVSGSRREKEEAEAEVETLQKGVEGVQISA